MGEDDDTLLKISFAFIAMYIVKSNPLLSFDSLIVLSLTAIFLIKKPDIRDIMTICIMLIPSVKIIIWILFTYDIESIIFLTLLTVVYIWLYEKDKSMASEESIKFIIEDGYIDKDTVKFNIDLHGLIFTLVLFTATLLTNWQLLAISSGVLAVVVYVLSDEKIEKRTKKKWPFKVTLVEGDITEQDTNVIVNTTTPNLNLSNGGVSQAILTAGGYGIQEECNRRHMLGIEVGEIAETSGGNMPCQAVYHTTLEEWSGKSEIRQELCDLIKKCLARASDSGQKSISFPMLGVGSLGYPPGMVARCIFESLDIFSTSHPSVSLTEVRIVVLPTDVENMKALNEASEIHEDGYLGRSHGAEFSIPQEWAPMKESDFYSCVELSSSDKEYQEVAHAFTNGVGSAYMIIEIERVQNKTLHIQYQTLKKRMKAENPGMQIEHTLWHGTGYDAIQSINTYGFSRSYTGKNATVYGEGTYFAVSPQYSARSTYSPQRRNGHRHMYMVSVLTGHFTYGQQGMRTPPPRDAKRPHVKYDTVVDDTDKPSMFVVFNDVQAYPKYQITFKKSQ